mgnify:CR=1 FL=1
MIESLYIHIPFCDSICSYCSFKKQIYNEEQSKKYILNLLKDLERIPKCSLKTIYIGGGTPSSLADNEFEILLSCLKPLLKEDYEFTIESNPENLTINKARLFNKYGVNRVSIGVQTFNDKFLKILGRKHNLNDITNAVNNLLINNINNISFDLIYGLPFQTLEDFLSDIKKLNNFPLTHISLYSLTIDENTIFNNLKYEEADEDLLRDMSDEATKILSEYGFNKYELVHNGVDFENIRKQITDKQTAREKFGFNSNDYIISAVGRLNKIKKFDFLIKVFSHIVKYKNDVKLVIAGDGEELYNNLVTLGEITPEVEEPDTSKI